MQDLRCHLHQPRLSVRGYSRGLKVLGRELHSLTLRVQQRRIHYTKSTTAIPRLVRADRQVGRT